MFKLRAQDARARQEWVNRLRAVAELHAMAVAHVSHASHVSLLNWPSILHGVSKVPLPLYLTFKRRKM